MMEYTEEQVQEAKELLEYFNVEAFTYDTGLASALRECQKELENKEAIIQKWTVGKEPDETELIDAESELKVYGFDAKQIVARGQVFIKMCVENQKLRKELEQANGEIARKDLAIRKMCRENWCDDPTVSGDNDETACGSCHHCIGNQALSPDPTWLSRHDAEVRRKAFEEAARIVNVEEGQDHVSNLRGIFESKAKEIV